MSDSGPSVLPSLGQAPAATPLLGADGRTVIVALDHALAAGQAAGLDDPAGLLATFAAGQVDAAILTPGGARIRDAVAPRLPWLLTADYFATSVDPGHPADAEIHGVLWSAEHAARLGASGLKCLWVHGQTDAEAHLGSLRQVAALVEAAHRVGLPVMVEAVLWGPRLAAEHEHDGERVANAARMAFELGADLIKVAMPDDVAPLARVTSAVPVPIVAMGGPAHDPALLFARIRRVLDAGLRGVALGRNVWRAPRPDRMVQALHAMVHEDRSDREALEIVGEAAAS